MNTQVDLNTGAREAALSICEQLGDKHVLITGVTGFVGKVLLTMIAAHVPNVRRVSVLVRPNRRHDNARARFDAEVIPSKPFEEVAKRVDQERGGGEL